VSTSGTVNSEIVLKIQPYDGDGLSFINVSQGQTTNVKFDGSDNVILGTNMPSGLTCSARRVGAHALEMTYKLDGKIANTRQVQLSFDLKTMTITSDTPGVSDPDILVFERQ
jgi:hypothetical protein